MKRLAPRQPQELGTLLAAFAFLLPLLYFGFTRDSSALPRYALSSVAAGVGLVVWGARQLRSRIGLTWNPVFYPVLGFLLLATASWNWSVDPRNSRIELLQLASFVALSILAMQAAAGGQTARVLRAGAVAGTLAALLGVLQYFGLEPIHLRQLAPPASTFTNKNIAANYMDMVAPLSFALLLLARRPAGIWASALALAASLSFLLLSHSRGSWVALLATVLILVLVLWRRAETRAAVAAAVQRNALPLALAIIVPFVLAQLPGERFQDGFEANRSFSGELDKSSRTRLNAYLNALEMIKERPWSGVGYGGFRLGFRPSMFAVAPIDVATENNAMMRLHNDHLQAFVELGIPGGLLQLGVVVWVWLLALRIAACSIERNRQLLGLGLLLGMTASFTHAAVDFPLHKPAAAGMLWLLMGLTAGLFAAHTADRSPRRGAATKAVLALLAGLALTVYSAGFYQKYLQNSADIQLTQDAMDHWDCAQAKAAVDRAMGRFNYDYWTQITYAMIYRVCPIPPQEKRAAMDRLLNYDPYNTVALLVRADVRLSQRQLEGATDDYLALVKIIPNRAVGYVGLGRIALAEKRYQAARKLYEAALSTDPQQSEAKEVLKKLAAAGG